LVIGPPRENWLMRRGARVVGLDNSSNARGLAAPSRLLRHAPDPYIDAFQVTHTYMPADYDQHDDEFIGMT
jgi:hypothetical protein